MKKPRKWFTNKTTRKLSPKAKEYLGFKLRAYWRAKRLTETSIEVSEQRQKPKPSYRTPIRIILNAQTSDKNNNKLFLEVMIECFNYQYNDAVDFILNKISQKFGSYIKDALVIGSDYPKKVNKFFLKGNTYSERYLIKYRHNFRENWRLLK